MNFVGFKVNFRQIHCELYVESTYITLRFDKHCPPESLYQCDASQHEIIIKVSMYIQLDTFGIKKDKEINPIVQDS